MEKNTKIIPFKNKFIDIFQLFFQKYYFFTEPLNKIHLLLNTDYISKEDKQYFSKIQSIGKNDRQSIFIKNYHHFVDNDSFLLETYHSFVIENIKPLFQNEEFIVIQKTPNLRISLPFSTAIGKREDDPVGIIGLHSDSDFGHHSEEINFIIPITSMFDTNSIYYQSDVSISEKCHEYSNLSLNIDEFFMAKFNILKHYNKINTTNVSRISLDIRIIPYSKYVENIDFFHNTKFELGNYYIKL